MLTSPEIQGKIKDAAAKLHKRITGRGPDSMGIDITNQTIVLSFRHFLTPIERCVLRDPENQALIRQLRDALATVLVEDWNQVLGEYGLEVSSIDGEIDFEQEKRVVRLGVQKKRP